MLKPLVLPVKAGTEAAEAAFGKLTAGVIAGMAGVSAAAATAHRSVGTSMDGMGQNVARLGGQFTSLQAAAQAGMGSVSGAALAMHQQGGSALDGFGTKALTALRAIGQLAVAHKILTTALVAYAAAAATGFAELERFQKLAEKAAASDVGTTYFQAWTRGAEQFRIAAAAAQADLAAAEKATRDRFDGDRASGVSNQALELMQSRFRGTNDFGLSGSPTQFAQANSAEERLTAVRQYLVDLERNGHGLVAVADAVALGFGNIAEKVATGRATFAGWHAEIERVKATGVADGSIVSPELIRRADELKDRWEKNSQELSKNLRPILDECARLANEIGNGAAWASEQFTRLVGVVGRVVAALRQAADASKFTLTNAQEETEAGLRTNLETRLRDAGLTPQQRRGFEAQLAEMNAVRTRREQSRQARAEASDVPEPPITFSYEGTGSRGNPVTMAAPPVPLRRPPVAPAGSPPSGGGSSADETDKRTEAIEKFIRAQEKGIELSRVELETVGRSATERARLTEVVKAEAQAREHGGRLTETERDRVAALAEAHQRLKDSIKDAEAAQRALGDAFQWAGDRIVDMAFNGRTFTDVLKGMSVELARAALTGQGIFGRLLGLAPGASAAPGSLGGLMGLLQGGVTYTGGGGGGGGLLGGLFGLFGGLGGFGGMTGTAILHEGGVVGAGGRPGLAPAALFAGAPRFHAGGRLAPDEVPIIGRKAEEMLTRNQRIAAGRVMDFAERAGAARNQPPSVIDRRSYHFSGVTAGDRQWIRGEIDRSSQETRSAIVPTVQDADRHGLEIQPYTRGT